MTVSSTTNRITFAGNGATTSFATSPVIFFNSSELAVYAVTDATGASTTLVENTGYTVTGGSGSTGTVNTAAGSSPYGAPAVGVTLVIVRTMPLTQATDLVNNDINDAEVMEDALDKLTMIDQQATDTYSRAIRLASSDTSDGNTMILPNDINRASKVLGFDASGDVTTYNSSSSVTTSSNVSWTQQGTGAVARTVEAKLYEVITSADFGNTRGTSNVVVGLGTTYANTTGQANTSVGANALKLNTTGITNTAIGETSLDANTTGSNNVAVGGGALGANTTASGNVAVGVNAASSNTTGDTNVAVGNTALSLNVTGSANTAIGAEALLNNTVTGNTAVGNAALKANTTGTGMWPLETRRCRQTPPEATTRLSEMARSLPLLPPVSTPQSGKTP